MAEPKQLPSGAWRIQPSFTLPNGKIVRKSITASSRKEARHLAELWLEEREAEQQTQKTLGHAIDDYIYTCEKRQLSPSTIKEYVSRRKTSFPDIIDCKIDQLTAAMIQKQLDTRLETVSIKTAKNDFYFLKPVLELHAPKLDLSKIRLGKKQKSKKTTMQESWRVAIPKKIIEFYGKSDFYLYILFIIYTGMRPSESYGLTWGDLSPTPLDQTTPDGDIQQVGFINITKAVVRDKDNNYIVKNTKTEAGIRLLSVSWSFFEELYSTRPRGKDSERIFLRNPYCNERKWKKIKKELSLPDNLRQYDLRHFHATDIALCGASEEEIMARMGHSSAAFSHAVYIELFGEHESVVNAKLVAKIDAAIKILNASENASALSKV